MTVALLSLGSNMGDSRHLLVEAVRALGAAVLRVSSVYRTPPWGPVAQDDFLNIALLVADPAVDAHGWLGRCHELERAAQRVRDVRWGPRTLDADVVCVWRSDAGAAADLPTEELTDAHAVISDDLALTLPHPRAHERGFVLVPWHEIQPNASLPGHGLVGELIATVDVTGIDNVGDLNASTP